jgi:hypothetical protein
MTIAEGEYILARLDAMEWSPAASGIVYLVRNELASAIEAMVLEEELAATDPPGICASSAPPAGG